MSNVDTNQNDANEEIKRGITDDWWKADMPGEELIKNGQQLPVFEKDHTENKLSRDYDEVVMVRMWNTGEVVAVVSIQGLSSNEVDEPFDRGRLTVDIREEMKRRGLGENHMVTEELVKVHELDEGGKYNSVVTNAEQMTGGKSLYEYTMSEDTD